MKDDFNIEENFGILSPFLHLTSKTKSYTNFLFFMNVSIDKTNCKYVVTKTIQKPEFKSINDDSVDVSPFSTR